MFEQNRKMLPVPEDGKEALILGNDTMWRAHHSRQAEIHGQEVPDGRPSLVFARWRAGAHKVLTLYYRPEEDDSFILIGTHTPSGQEGVAVTVFEFGDEAVVAGGVRRILNNELAEDEEGAVRLAQLSLSLDTAPEFDPDAALELAKALATLK
jgi:hypothetical protein